MKTFFYAISFALISLTVASCSCDNPPTCKFEKGDDVQNKSSRWAKKGAVTDVWVSSDCDCMYEVSNTTWIEGRRFRTYYEYELEEPGNGLDKDALELVKELF